MTTKPLTIKHLLSLIFYLFSIIFYLNKVFGLVVDTCLA